MAHETFTCEACRKTYHKDPDWSDEDADAEAIQLWGPQATEDMAVICEDCFRAIGDARKLIV